MALAPPAEVPTARMSSRASLSFDASSRPANPMRCRSVGSKHGIGEIHQTVRPAGTRPSESWSPMAGYLANSRRASATGGRVTWYNRASDGRGPIESQAARRTSARQVDRTGGIARGGRAHFNPGVSFGCPIDKALENAKGGELVRIFAHRHLEWGEFDAGTPESRFVLEYGDPSSRYPRRRRRFGFPTGLRRHQSTASSPHVHGSRAMSYASRARALPLIAAACRSARSDGSGSVAGRPAGLREARVR